MDKVIAGAAHAVADVTSGLSPAVGGFGPVASRQC
jgi:acyl CoA:acetate/3-ketoacid CoA transferase alpha subunit